MIEKRIKNEQTLKKWRAFKAHRTGYFSIWIILIACFFSFTAEFWANSKPLVLNYEGKIYFPVFKEYSVKEFGVTDTLAMDYRELKLREGDWDLWPIIEWDPYESNKDVAEYPSAPSAKNILGTDDRGRDVLTRLLYGLRYSIGYAVLVWLLTFFIGTILGSLQGYFGGWFDLIMQRITEILSTIPTLFLLIILISIFEPSLTLLILITSMFGWILISVYMRAEFLKNRKREYVEAARSIGVSNFKIITKHILPNSLGPIITFSPFVIAGGITGLAALDYLGFGLAPPTPSWGELLAQAQKNFTIGWWLVVYPFASLFIILVSFNFIGEAVRNALDPHKRT
ncbi:MAG: ABC transporter permease subunit [Halobacteriovoraceae bacterium]|jgi:microcin C transport system permease protein|nr:ABC transporter permease subunit [Halobacteriovoraceae bacterium]